MSAFFAYLLKSTLLLAVFYTYFLLVMRRSEHFRFNRSVLLAGSALCLLLPLIRVRVSVPTVYSEWLEPAVVGGGAGAPAPGAAEAAANAAAPAGLPWPALLLGLYLLGAAMTLAFYLRSYAGMFRMLRSAPGERRDGYTLHVVEQDTPSFSWLHHVVVSRADAGRYPAILAHELAHVRCGHSRDLLLSSALTVFQWFNPLVWICRTELKLLHEYEADDCVLNQGIDATQYQLLLVKKAVGEKRFLLANGFNHAQLKNRITMMQNTSHAAWKKLSALLLLPLLAATIFLLAECKPAANSNPQPVDETATQADKAAPAEPVYEVTVTDEPEEEVVDFSLVEVKPVFNDGDVNSFPLWVNKKLQYPEEARENKVEGRVTLQFTVDTDGSVKDVKVVKGVDPILDSEAVKVVSQSPKWTPAMQNGKPVRVHYIIPVIFKLQ